MKTLNSIALMLLLAASIFAQGSINTTENVYPSRIGNYCLSDNAVASASSEHHTGNYPASAAIDGDRIGQAWGMGGGWNDDTYETYPDWLRVDFGRSHSISRIVVVTFQDDYGSPRVEPYLGLQVGHYGIEDFTIEVLTASGWVEVADVEENEDIIREFTFAPVTGTAIRITITGAYVSFSRVIEFEAYAV